MAWFGKKGFGKKNNEYYEEIPGQYEEEYEDEYEDAYGDDYGDYEDGGYDEPSLSSRRGKSEGSKVISMPEYTRKAEPAERDMKMVIFKPSSYDETENVIDSLRARKPIVVNLDEINPAVAQRILDFISGAVYALNGDIRRAARNIFVVAPSNIEISTNELDDSLDTEL